MTTKIIIVGAGISGLSAGIYGQMDYSTDLQRPEYRIQLTPIAAE